jgi:splicing factor 3B subunit 5
MSSSAAALLSDRFDSQHHLSLSQLQYAGTGHADTTKREWFLHQQRDSYCSYLGHTPMLDYLSCVQNQSRGRIRFDLLSKIASPINKQSKKEKPNNSQIQNGKSGEEMEEE